MKFSKVVAATAWAVLMTACNSGNDNGAAAMTYDFIVPATNSQRSYEQTIVDNSDNAIKETFSDTVTSVNTDNAYVVLQEDTTGTSIVVDGTTYSIPTETIDVDAQGSGHVVFLHRCERNGSRHAPIVRTDLGRGIRSPSEGLGRPITR
jgi:hypothetical protein